MDVFYNCIDAGSKYCPCELADSLNCISCSHLNGKDYCDCNWNGVCILYEYYMNNMESKDHRKSYRGLVIDKKNLGDNLYLLKIKTKENLIEEMDIVGSYVFVNKFKDKSYYNAPMSLSYMDKEHIYIVYDEIGPKTKGISKGDILGIKGPYFNGIIGGKRLSNIKNSNILILGRGLGQSSIILPIEKLKRENEIYLFLDKGKTSSTYALDFIENENVCVREIDFFEDKGEKELLIFLKENKIDIVFSAGSEMLQRKVKSINTISILFSLRNISNSFSPLSSI
ncbi:MAG: hypothetical protein GX968_06420 [Tissierellia bacterium]|nr:hypothetical protein [Tissierellia bacterium]